MGPGFESLKVHQEKRPFLNGLFSIQSEGLVCNLTEGEYVIAVRRMASRFSVYCSFGLIPYKANALIPYRRQAADYIHANGVVFQSCIFVLRAQKKALAKASAFFNEAHLAVHEK